MGLPFGTPGEPVQYFKSSCGHEVRILSLDASGDFHYEATETASEILARLAPAFKPDYLICWCPEVIPPPLKLEDAPVCTVAVVSDWTVYHSALRHNLQRFNLVIMDKLACHLQPFHDVTPHYLGPLYSQRRGIHRNLETFRDLDIVFVGNLNHATHRERGHYLERIARLADRYRVVIASGLDAQTYTEILNRAKIVFNFGLRGEMNLRCFEALACGAVLFMEEANMEVRDLLTPDESVVLYTAENLEARLAWYLDHDAARETVARNGLTLSESLAGEKRLDTFLNALAELPEAPATFNERTPREQLLATVRCYASSEIDAQVAYSQSCLAEAVQAYPYDTEVQFCHAVSLLDQFNAGQRPTGAKEALDLLSALAARIPDEAPVWMCMARIARQAGAQELELRCIQSALEANSIALGDLLPGKRNDPWYGQWRTNLALGEANVEYLHDWMFTRLAEIELDHGHGRRVLDFYPVGTEKTSVMAEPFAVRGKALMMEGRLNEAIAVLEAGLSKTALDSAYRKILIDAYVQAGRMEDARSLARESATIFHAWWGAETVTQDFSDLLQSLEER